MALEPRVNHWWHVPLYVSARGLTTGAMPIAGSGPASRARVRLLRSRAVASHRATAASTRCRSPGLSVQRFYDEVMARLARLDVRRPHLAGSGGSHQCHSVSPRTLARAYDAEYVRRFWHVLIRADEALRRFRTSFIGKVSPVHFFWGSFDLAVTRFSGRTAPPHPGGIPNLARLGRARRLFTRSQQLRLLARRSRRRCRLLRVCVSGTGRLLHVSARRGRCDVQHHDAGVRPAVRPRARRATIRRRCWRGFSSGPTRRRRCTASGIARRSSADAPAPDADRGRGRQRTRPTSSRAADTGRAPRRSSFRSSTPCPPSADRR